MTLQELALVAEAHAEAAATALAAGEARAVGAYEARAAGATLGQIAAALGIDRANVPALIRRGAHLARAC